MRSITDREGNSWVLEMDLATYRRIRATIIPEFLETEQKSCEQLYELSQNRLKLCEVLWEFCRHEASERKISEDDFFRLFPPSVIPECYAEVVESTVDFFPHIRPMISRILAEIEAAKETIESELQSTFESIPPGKLVALDMDGLRKRLSSMRESLE